MIDFTNGNNSNRFDPDIYIKTKSGGVLAFVKVLEAIAAAAGFVCLAIGYFGVSTLFDSITASVNAVINQYLPTAMIRLPEFAAKSSFLLPAIFLVLLMLDGIGTFMIRFLNQGENLVRFVHLIYQIVSILEIIFFIVIVILLLHYASDESTASIAAFGALGILTIPITGGSLAVLFFQSGFHHDIRTVLKTVHEEKRSGQNLVVGDNHLAGRSSCLAWGSGITFAYSAFLFIYPLVTHKQINQETSPISIPNLAPVITLAINFVFWLFTFLKYLSLRICTGNFKKYHTSKTKKSSSFIWIILIILLCVGAYFFGKNNGFRQRTNKNFTESLNIFRTATPSFSEKRNVSTTVPGEIRNQLPTPTTAQVSSNTSSNPGGVDPDLKEFLDGYEKFMDEYVVFMKRYAANPTDLSLLTQYASMLSELEKYSEAADRYSEKESEMSAADLAYYTAVMIRINNKLLSVY